MSILLVSFGQPATNTGFGAAPAPAPATNTFGTPGGFSFGAKPAQPAATSGFGGFGTQPTMNTQSGFGGFGSTAQVGQQQANTDRPYGSQPLLEVQPVLNLSTKPLNPTTTQKPTFASPSRVTPRTTSKLKPRGFTSSIPQDPGLQFVDPFAAAKRTGVKNLDILHPPLKHSMTVFGPNQTPATLQRSQKPSSTQPTSPTRHTAPITPSHRKSIAQSPQPLASSPTYSERSPPRESPRPYHLETPMRSENVTWQSPLRDPGSNRRVLVNDQRSSAKKDSASRSEAYWTSPTIDELENMSTNQLKRLPRFEVGRNGFGSVAWEGDVDLTAFEGKFDTICGEVVQLVAKRCTVYQDVESKPERGTSLNRKALIQLEQCWPKDKATGLPDKDPNSIRSIQLAAKLSKMPDTTMINYDAVNGIWKFTVDHFTTYGLCDSDDETTPLPPNSSAGRPPNGRQNPPRLVSGQPSTQQDFRRGTAALGNHESANARDSASSYHPPTTQRISVLDNQPNIPRWYAEMNPEEVEEEYGYDEVDAEIEENQSESMDEDDNEESVSAKDDTAIGEAPEPENVDDQPMTNNVASTTRRTVLPDIPYTQSYAFQHEDVRQNAGLAFARMQRSSWTKQLRISRVMKRKREEAYTYDSHEAFRIPGIDITIAAASYQKPSTVQSQSFAGHLQSLTTFF